MTWGGNKTIQQKIRERYRGGGLPPGPGARQPGPPSPVARLGKAGSGVILVGRGRTYNGVGRRQLRGGQIGRWMRREGHRAGGQCWGLGGSVAAQAGEHDKWMEPSEGRGSDGMDATAKELVIA